MLTLFPLHKIFWVGGKSFIQSNLDYPDLDYLDRFLCSQFGHEYFISHDQDPF